jgi:hypothetical protein
MLYSSSTRPQIPQLGKGSLFDSWPLDQLQQHALFACRKCPITARNWGAQAPLAGVQPDSEGIATGLRGVCGAMG